MSKGDLTRSRVLDSAFESATRLGLGGLSLGELASQLGLSKSGLFAHFGSKEALQLAVIEHARARFVELVVAPALKCPRGEERVRALFRNWLAWGRASVADGGCFFVQAAAEFDDQPGSLRDALVASQQDWLSTLAEAARIAVREGHFARDTDVERFAFDLYALAFGYHQLARLLRDARFDGWVELGFDRLLASVRKVRARA